MRNLWIILSAVFFLASASFGLELESFIRSVWDNSEQLKGKKELTELIEGDRWRRFTPSEPQFFFISQDNGGWQQGGLILNVAFPGRSLLMTGPDASRATAANHELSATKLDLTRSATDVFLDCASSQQQLELQQKNLLDLQTLSRSLDKLYERGHSSQTETLASKLQLRQLDSDVKLLESKTRLLCARLRTLFPNMATDEDLSMPEDLTQSLVKEIGSDSSEVARAKAQLENAKAQIDSAT